MIEYNATKLAAVAFAMSTEETRYYLCGVYFKGSLAVATDGHMMTVANDADQDNYEGIYPISKKAHAAMKKKTAERVVIQDAILTVYDDQNQALHMEPCEHIDGTFPDWRHVCPQSRGEATTGFFSHVVHVKMAATAKQIQASGYRLTSTSKLDPHYVDYNRADLFSVVMPMRADEHLENADLPEWIDAKD